MIRFANTIDIDREPSEVYAYLADLEHTPEWNWAITSSQKTTPGPAAVGARYRQMRSAPRAGVEILEITRLDEPRRIDVTGKVGPFRARLIYELVQRPAGTRLTNSVELEPPIPLGPFGEVVAGRVRTSVADNLQVLKQQLEAANSSRA